jgi:3-phenylpropionate/trans-cinnamate dioxygenase ferredoxin subunit
MAEQIKVFDKDELKDGTMMELLIAGHDILIARVGDNYYAVDNRCPHMGGKLCRGKLNGTVVTCSLHGSQFDLQSGQVIRWTNLTGFMYWVSKMIKPPKPVTTYDLKVINETVYVEI